MTRLFETVRGAFHDETLRSYSILHSVVWTLIVVSVGLFVFELGFGREHPWWPALQRLDRAVLVFFTIEVTLRVATFVPPTVRFFQLNPRSRVLTHVVGRLRFCLRPLIMVDILTVLALVPVLRGLRALRLLRLVRTRRLLKYSSPFASIERAFRENRLLYSVAFSWLGAQVLLGGMTLYLVERGRNDDIESLADGFWWALVTLTTVGFGDITPQTSIGRLTGAFLMVGGLFTIALFAGLIGHTLLSEVLSIREDQYRMSDFIDHLVVMGYSPGARMLIAALQDERFRRPPTVVFMGPGPRPADLPAEFMWVVGDPAKEAELPKARLSRARAVIIVASRKSDPQQADATTILITFTLRRYMSSQEESARRQRPLYVVAEILEAENVQHARTAGADEVIESTRLGFSLITHAITEPGTAHVISEMSVASGQNVYVGALPPGVVLPMCFDDLAARLHREGALLIGVRDPETGQDLLNPDGDFSVTGQQCMIYVASHPVLPAA